mmetsp:Transcript_104809/g.337947  ORF Transcript_104809/g.337947 Transcript_104809/m.337947 type:complete len:326 (+) Transcript_104809:532-1509(+)
MPPDPRPRGRRPRRRARATAPPRHWPGPRRGGKPPPRRPASAGSSGQAPGGNARSGPGLPPAAQAVPPGQRWLRQRPEANAGPDLGAGGLSGPVLRLASPRALRRAPPLPPVPVSWKATTRNCPATVARPVRRIARRAGAPPRGTSGRRPRCSPRAGHSARPCGSPMPRAARPVASAGNGPPDGSAPPGPLRACTSQAGRGSPVHRSAAAGGPPGPPRERPRPACPLCARGPPTASRCVGQGPANAARQPPAACAPALAASQPRPPQGHSAGPWPPPPVGARRSGAWPRWRAAPRARNAPSPPQRPKAARPGTPAPRRNQIPCAL